MDINQLLNSDKRIEINTNLNTFACEYCRRTFKSRPVLRRHLKSVHTQPIPCYFCSKSLKISGRLDLLRSHLEHCLEFKRYLVTNDMGDVVQQAQIFAKKLSKDHFSLESEIEN
eukprot:NODE_1040_length_2493_cov_0.830827.p3 type:complete len:114 gc:universal NODE_1040_length_2493_cov_0.830827:852-1193(+)